MRLAVLSLAALATLAACDSSLEVQPCTDTSPLAIVDSLEVPGTGQPATINSVVNVRYRGQLTNGVVFDSTGVDGNGTPRVATLVLPRMLLGFRFGVGGTETIPAMKIGGTRRIVVPPNLGYGPVENGDIPACSTLLFDVELVDLG